MVISGSSGIPDGPVISGYANLVPSSVSAFALSISSANVSSTETFASFSTSASEVLSLTLPALTIALSTLAASSVPFSIPSKDLKASTTVLCAFSSTLCPSGDIRFLTAFSAATESVSPAFSASLIRASIVLLSFLFSFFNAPNTNAPITGFNAAVAPAAILP